MYNIHDAKTNFSKLIARVEEGETIVISRAGKPVAKLAPIQQIETRRTGFLSGLADIPEDFDELLQDEVGKLFEPEVSSEDSA